MQQRKSGCRLKTGVYASSDKRTFKGSGMARRTMMSWWWSRFRTSERYFREKLCMRSVSSMDMWFWLMYRSTWPCCRHFSSLDTRSSVMACVTVLKKLENTKKATTIKHILKTRSRAFRGTTSMDAGTNCVRDQCNDVVYKYMMDGSGFLSSISCTQFVSVPLVGRSPTANHAQATKWFIKLNTENSFTTLSKVLTSSPYAKYRLCSMAVATLTMRINLTILINLAARTERSKRDSLVYSSVTINNQSTPRTVMSGRNHVLL
mmetsp:Transcript_25592/g.59128  ORF Transcript_25592/g.59128 Transcript_25592/m.59128 type:complete len:262 (+) Transcript_25592:561-1346(+)